MSFLESQRFPPDIRAGVTGGPEYSTTVITVGSGAEQRNRNWLEARGKWQLDHGPHDQAKTNSLISFFRVVGGRANGFRFKDWTDFQVDTSNGVVVANLDGSLQLCKKYEFGGWTEYRPIRKPISGTVTVTGGGTVDYTNGIVTGSSVGATWSGQFDVPVRFDSDSLQIQAVAVGLYQWANVSIVEIRV